jgi:hypothetical protein
MSPFVTFYRSSQLLAALSLSQAGARLCKCLGDEFIPYLPIVMPPLLKSAAMEADIKVGDSALKPDILLCFYHVSMMRS